MPNGQSSSLCYRGQAAPQAGEAVPKNTLVKGFSTRSSIWWAVESPGGNSRTTSRPRQTMRGADTVPTSSRGYDAGKKINGRKRHIAVDTGGLLLAVVVTVAGIQDRDGAFRLLSALSAKLSIVSLVWADVGYAGRSIVWAKRVLSLTVQIVKRSDDATGFDALPRQCVVERTCAWISKHRRCVRDYETRPDDHEAIVYIAMIMSMSRRLARVS